MMTKAEFLRTVRPDNKAGVRMDRSKYEMLKEFILDVLNKSDQVTINELLSQAQALFDKEFGENIGWYVYQVKLDLEARGLIKRERPAKRNKKAIVRKMHRKSAQKILQVMKEKEPVKVEVNREVKQKFLELFSENPMIIHSPGRINMIGEHTDYNNGYVMPAAIDKGMQFAVAPNKGKQSIIYSLKYNQFYSVDHNNLAKVKEPEWANYLLGILYQMDSAGLKVKPFNCVFDGDLPAGAGLSSSAAMECGFAFALNELNQFNLPKLDLIHMAQWAEHNYVGVKCGIMDQFTSMMGLEHHVMVLDCQRLTYSYSPLEIKDYSLVLCDTNVKHSLASSEYNTRRAECEQGVSLLQSRFPSIKSLRDVTMEMLLDNMDLLPEPVLNRCTYVVQENDRVLKASEDLQKGDLATFGKRMFQTHEGLSSLYRVSCPELDFLVEQAKTFTGVLGSRMMGGGFGGCTINIVHQNRVGDFIYHVKQKYKGQFRIGLTTHVVKTGNGTAMIENPLAKQ